MRKIDAYIFKKYLGTFFFAISMLILVVIIFDVSENIDSFLKHNAPWQKVVVDYYIMSIPYYINLFIHLFAFIAVVFFTSKMAARTEIVAILSSGISFWRFLVPYMFAAICIAVMSLYFGNFRQHHVAPLGIVAGDDVLACLAHQPQVETDVVEAGNHRAKDFARDEQMTEICPCILCIDESFAVGVNG